MSSIPSNYTPSATNGQDAYSSLPQNVKDKYIPSIIKNWQDLGLQAKLEKPLPQINQPTLYDHLNEERIRKELGIVREEFLIEARKLEEERIAVIKENLNKKYGDELSQAYITVENANKVINIQNAILGKIMDKNKNLLLDVLIEADITQEDLDSLANWKVKD